jgi:hypothetical protein
MMSDVYAGRNGAGERLGRTLNREEIKAHMQRDPDAFIDALWQNNVVFERDDGGIDLWAEEDCLVAEDEAA